MYFLSLSLSLTKVLHEQRHSKRHIDSIDLGFRIDGVYLPCHLPCLHCNTLPTLHHTTTHGTTLQHTAPHCTTLHHTAPHCNTLHHTATHCTTPRSFIDSAAQSATSTASMGYTSRVICHVYTTTHCTTLQHTTTHYNTLHHTATHCPHCTTLQHTAPHYNTLHHTATHCTTLQHTAPHYNTLQHTATHCTTLQRTATHCNALQHTACLHSVDSSCTRTSGARYPPPKIIITIEYIIE